MPHFSKLYFLPPFRICISFSLISVHTSLFHFLPVFLVFIRPLNPCLLFSFHFYYRYSLPRQPPPHTLFLKLSTLSLTHIPTLLSFLTFLTSKLTHPPSASPFLPPSSSTSPSNHSTIRSTPHYRPHLTPPTSSSSITHTARVDLAGRIPILRRVKTYLVT